MLVPLTPDQDPTPRFFKIQSKKRGTFYIPPLVHVFQRASPSRVFQVNSVNNVPYFPPEKEGYRQPLIVSRWNL